MAVLSDEHVKSLTSQWAEQRPAHIFFLPVFPSGSGVKNELVSHATGSSKSRLHEATYLLQWVAGRIEVTKSPFSVARQQSNPHSSVIVPTTRQMKCGAFEPGNTSRTQTRQWCSLPSPSTTARQSSQSVATESMNRRFHELYNGPCVGLKRMNSKDVDRIALIATR